jgi:DNA-binding transcriptional MerR regulator/methylmalonyl-CoA mutase cobalamin-binding subunit
LVSEPADESGVAYPIGVVTRRTGLSPDVLRVWERRYRVVSPSRNTGGQRLYSAVDIERLRLLQRLVERGHRIATIANLDLDALGKLASEIDVAHLTRSREVVDSLLDAVGRMDAARLESGLRRAAISVGAESWIDSIVGPLMEEVGNGWHAGTLTTAHEHLASATTRDVLSWILKSFGVDAKAPGILIATPSGELHELGALMAAVVAASAGWRVHYLGPNVPASDLATAARQLGVSCVALSIVYQKDGFGEVKAVRAALGERVPLIVGGKAAREAAAELAGTGVSIVPHARALRNHLEDSIVTD